MITRWIVTVTDGGDFRKRSREYEIDGSQFALLKRIADGMADELIPNSIHKMEIEYAGEGSKLPIKQLHVVMNGDLPICQDETCEQAQKCANHSSAHTADNNRSTDGMSPDLYYDNRFNGGKGRWGCTKADTNRYEGPRSGPGILVE